MHTLSIFSYNESKVYLQLFYGQILSASQNINHWHYYYPLRHVIRTICNIRTLLEDQEAFYVLR